MGKAAQGRGQESRQAVTAHYSHTGRGGSRPARCFMAVPLLKPSQAAAQLSLSADTIRRLYKRGDLPGVIIGGSLRIAQEAVDAIRQRAMPAAAPPALRVPDHLAAIAARRAARALKRRGGDP